MLLRLYLENGRKNPYYVVAAHIMGSGMLCPRYFKWDFENLNVASTSIQAFEKKNKRSLHNTQMKLLNQGIFYKFFLQPFSNLGSLSDTLVEHLPTFSGPFIN